MSDQALDKGPAVLEPGTASLSGMLLLRINSPQDVSEPLAYIHFSEIPFANGAVSLTAEDVKEFWAAMTERNRRAIMGPTNRLVTMSLETFIVSVMRAITDGTR